MPERLIPLLDSIFFTVISLFMVLVSLNVISIIIGTLTGLYWVAKIKRDIIRFHNGSVWEFIKWIVKKN